MNSLDNKNGAATKLKRENGKPRSGVIDGELLQRYLEEVKRRRFFGQVILKIEAGEIVYINEHAGLNRGELIEILEKNGDR